MAIQIILAVLSSLFLVTSLLFAALFFRTKHILDMRIYETKTIRDESLNIIEEIREDLKSGRVLLKIDRLDGDGLLYRTR